jgi:hypothetical protein
MAKSGRVRSPAVEIWFTVNALGERHALPQQLPHYQILQILLEVSSELRNVSEKPG